MIITSESPILKNSGIIGMTAGELEKKFGVEVLHYDDEPSCFYHLGDDYGRKPENETIINYGKYIKIKGECEGIGNFYRIDLRIKKTIGFLGCSKMERASELNIFDMKN